MGKNAVLLAMLMGISSLPTAIKARYIGSTAKKDHFLRTHAIKARYIGSTAKKDHFLRTHGGVQKIQAVRGYTGQSINLTIPSDPHHQIKAVTWTFSNQSGTIKLWDIENSDSSDVEKGKVLGLNNLRPEDQGFYEAEVTLHNNKVIFHQFHLLIYEPIPAPSITFDCNETLHCSVPSNASGLTYSWRFRHGDGDYQPYNVTGHIIQLPLRMFQGAEFQCIVSNSVDQKNVSMRLLNCHHYENRHHYFILFSAFLLVIFLVILIAVIYNRCKKKIKKSVEETDNTVALQDTSIHGKPVSYATYKDEIEQNETTQLQGCVTLRPEPIKLPEFIDIHPPKQKPGCQPIEVPTSAQHHGGRKEKTYGDS